MAQVKDYVRLWPLAIAAIGIAGFVYAAVQWNRPGGGQVEFAESDDEPVTDLLADEHYEKAEAHLVDEFTVYPGRVRVGGSIPVRVPRGMRVPVVKIHFEPGDFVKKGDTLVTFHRPKIEKAIEQMKAKGDTANEALFRSFLDYVELKSPVDGVVLRIERTLGEVPLDEGIPVVTLADKSSYRFVVQVPDAVERLSMPMNAKFDVELEDDIGTVKGTVTEFEPPVGTDVPVVLGLEPHVGIEDNLAGSVRVVSGRKEVGLIPKSAVLHRGDLAFVRVWDSESKAITERTVRLGEETGANVIVLAGVYVGESVVVPGRKRDP